MSRVSSRAADRTPAQREAAGAEQSVSPAVTALASHTTLGVGGTAQNFVCVNEVDELIASCREARACGRTLRILGGGSNVVVADEGPGDDWIVKLNLRGIAVASDCGDANAGSVRVTAGAGEVWDDVVSTSVQEGWAGIECLSGIPGAVGAAPIQNVGAYGQEVSETIEAVEVLDLERAERLQLSAAECGFSYRQSRFKLGAQGRYAVLAVTFRLREDGPPTLRYRDLADELGAAHVAPSLADELGAARVAPSLVDVRAAVLAIRARKSMVLRPGDENRRSCGSFFLNPMVAPAVAAEVEKRSGARSGDGSVPQFVQSDGRVKLSAAWLIEQTGFRKGLRRGPVGLSTRHTLALVAHQGARARDVVALAWEVRGGVEERFGVRLVPEPVFWGFERLDDGLPVL